MSKKGNSNKNLTTRRIVLAVIWGYLALASGWGVQVLDDRRTRGLLLIPLIVFSVLFVRALKRLFTDRVQEAIERALGKALRWLFHPAAVVASKIATWLGIGRWRGWGEDERTFLGRTKDKEVRYRRRLKNDQKWGDQEDNRARVRFLYIEYMIKRIRSGYTFRRQLTPDEIADELPLEEDEQLLFDTYTEARYARTADIPDAVVDVLSRVTARK
ncbi:MAG: hypothetical protein J6R04_05615 [Clostridia bacterium]|nr:hypothetical protein [Clostridia bacterium]